MIFGGLFEAKEVTKEEKRAFVGGELLRLCKLNDSLNDTVDLPSFIRARMALDLVEKNNALDFFFENKDLLKGIA